MRLILMALLTFFCLRSFAKESCTAEIIELKGEYVGCKTTVNEHVHQSDPTELTKLGCQTFCRSVTSQQNHLIDHVTDHLSDRLGNRRACCFNNETGFPLMYNPSTAKADYCENACRSIGQEATYPLPKRFICGINKNTGYPVSYHGFEGQDSTNICKEVCKNICRESETSSPPAAPSSAK
jgi:hypothetical protein